MSRERFDDTNDNAENKHTAELTQFVVILFTALPKSKVKFFIN